MYVFMSFHWIRFSFLNNSLSDWVCVWYNIKLFICCVEWCTKCTIWWRCCCELCIFHDLTNFYWDSNKNSLNFGQDFSNSTKLWFHSKMIATLFVVGISWFGCVVGEKFRFYPMATSINKHSLINQQHYNFMHFRFKGMVLEAVHMILVYK